MKLRPANFRLFLAAGLLASLILALILAVSPRSHDFVHKDSAAAQHECAVTLIASGKYEQADAPVLTSILRPRVQWGKIPSVHAVWVAAPFLGACVFEHAPPALF